MNKYDTIRHIGLTLMLTVFFSATSSTACLHMVTDRVFDESKSTNDIFTELISPIIESGMNGINGKYIHSITFVSKKKRQFFGVTLLK